MQPLQLRHLLQVKTHTNGVPSVLGNIILISVPKIKDLDLDKRKEKVKKMGLCFICLKSNHLSRSCTSGKNCGWCKGKHHRVLCMRNFNNKSAVKNTFKLSTYEGNSIQDLGRGGSVRNLDANAPSL